MAERTVSTRLLLKVSGFTGPLKEAGAGVKEFTTSFQQASEEGATGFDTLTETAGIAGAAMLAGFGVAVNAAAEFDKQMSSVGAAANATGKDLNSLREAALQAGADTSFSALEAAEAQEELAKAGLKTSDILGGGLQGALNLAAAGQLEVADAAGIAAVALAQFNLKANQVGHVADLLAAGANKALGSVGDLGMALKQGGLVAAQFGLSIDETVGGLASFAKEGLLGSDAGTSMKTMLLALANPAKETAKLMAQLNINAYDAKGNFVGLAGLAGQLRTSLSGLTQAQRDQAMAQIFGSDAVRAANVLYKNGADGIKKWTKDVNESGAASRVAGLEMDNLSGDMEELQGAIDTALIQTGSSATGVLRILVQSAGALVDGFVGAPGILQATATGVGLVAGSALTAAGAYGLMAPKVREASAALIGLGAAGAKANTALIGTAKWGGLAVAALVGLTVVNTIGHQFEAAAPNVDKLTDSLKKFIAGGKVAGEMSRVFTPDISRLKDAIEIQRSSLEHPNAAKIGSFLSAPFDAWSEESNQKKLRGLKAFDEALGAMVNSGNAFEASLAVERVGISGKEVAEILPSYSKAVEDADKASKEAAKSIETAAGQTRVLAGGLAAAVEEAGSLKDVLKGLNDVNMAGFEAQNRYQLGLNSLTKELKANGAAFKGTKDAAIENRQAVADQIQLAQSYLASQYEVIKSKDSEAAANKWASSTYVTLRAQIIGAATAAGISKAAVAALVDELFRMPESSPVQVSAPGAVRAEGEVNRLNDELKRVKDRLAKVNVQGPFEATNEVIRLRHEMERLQSKQIRIAVTQTYSYNGPQIPIAGLPRGIDKSRWGNIYSYASGGVRQAKVAKAGTLVQWAEPETGGEAYVPRRGDPARSRAIIDEAASWYGGQVAYGSTPSMAGATYGTSSSGGGGSGATYVLQMSFAPGADLRKAGAYFSEAIAAYESKGGRRSS